jgi:outer membrane receptor protein involved in Fe transport
MNITPTRHVLVLFSALSLGVASIRAQAVAPAKEPSGSRAQTAAPSVPPPAPASDSSDERVITLDPFTVTTNYEGYKADDTLGGARIRTKLIDTPSSTSVITPKFLQDLGVTKSEDLLRYTTSTETGGFYGNYSGMTSRGAGISGAAEGERLANPSGINRSRGLSALDNTRNYLLSSIPWDGFNISRIDISRGPNSFLFGVGSPSGISNVTTNDATYKNGGSAEIRFGSFESTRESIGLNRVIIPNELAVRLDLVDDNAKYRQDPAFNHSKRAYAALRYDPKFLRFPSARTKIQANFEHGKVRSNNPRTLPPLDYITGYLRDPRASSTGYNPWTYAMAPVGSGATDLNASYYTSAGSIGNWYQWGNGTQYYWDAKTGALLNAGQPGFGSPTGANYGAATNRYHVHSAGYNTFAKNANGVYRQETGVDAGPFAGAAEGSVTYFDQTLSDRSVFDYYNKLVDGPNKREWQDWNAFNVNFVQSLFNNKLTLQAVVAHEEYKRGQEGVLSSLTPSLMLDLDQYLLEYPTWLQATPNPNLGRPLLFGPYGDGRRDRTERDNYQFTAAYNLDFGDMLRNERTASILGRHELTGLISRSTATESNLGYKLAGIDHRYATAYAGAAKLSENNINWLAYLGPSMLGAKAARSDLSNLTGRIDPTSYAMRVYDRTWTANASVNPTSPWTFTGPDGAPTTLTQADNPANYRGYTRVPASVMTSATNMDDLRTKSSMRDQRIDSRAVMYQGHFWNDTLIPSFGYRQDKTRQRGNTAVQDSTTGYYPEIKEITDNGISTTTHSTSYGVAAHLPKRIKEKLPAGTDLSLYYFHGANETPKVRYAIDGSQLPNEKGKTDDYSIQLDYRNRLTLRLTKFTTRNYNAQASYGSPLGGSGWFIGAAPNWALTMGAAALVAFERPDSEIPQGLRDNSWIYNWARDPAHAALMPQIAQAFKTEFTKMFPQSFWDQYGSNVDVAAIQRGDWLNVLKDTQVMLPWTIKGFGAEIHGQTTIIDQDVESKGYELEVTARPIENWEVTFNASRVKATQTALGDAATRHLTGMAHVFLDTPIGQTAMWGGYNVLGAWRQEFMKNLWAPFNVQRALTGSDQPELRKWRFNGITNYKFNRGLVRGLNIGGAVRWEDKPTLGYAIHQTQIPGGQTLWISDVNRPLYGKSEQHFDLWVGYERKLTQAIDWRLQFNLRNVGEKTGLVPITLQPNGDVAQARIREGQTFEVSMKFSF